MLNGRAERIVDAVSQYIADIAVIVICRGEENLELAIYGYSRRV